MLKRTDVKIGLSKVKLGSFDDAMYTEHIGINLLAVSRMALEWNSFSAHHYKL